MKWISSLEREYSCSHVNKCDILISIDDEVYPWNTDLPAPAKAFKWIYLSDVFENFNYNGRTPEKCACKPD